MIHDQKSTYRHQLCFSNVPIPHCSCSLLQSCKLVKVSGEESEATGVLVEISVTKQISTTWQHLISGNKWHRIGLDQVLCNGPSDSKAICCRSAATFEVKWTKWFHWIELNETAPGQCSLGLLSAISSVLVSLPNSSTMTKERSVATLRIHAAWPSVTSTSHVTGGSFQNSGRIPFSLTTLTVSNFSRWLPKQLQLLACYPDFLPLQEIWRITSSYNALHLRSTSSISAMKVEIPRALTNWSACRVSHIGNFRSGLATACQTLLRGTCDIPPRNDLKTQPVQPSIAMSRAIDNSPKLMKSSCILASTHDRVETWKNSASTLLRSASNAPVSSAQLYGF